MRVPATSIRSIGTWSLIAATVRSRQRQAWIRRSGLRSGSSNSVPSAGSLCVLRVTLGVVMLHHRRCCNRLRTLGRAALLQLAFFYVLVHPLLFVAHARQMMLLRHRCHLLINSNA